MQMKGGWFALCVDSRAVPYQAPSLFSAKFLSRHATGETHCSIAPPSHITAKKINNSFHVGSAFRLSHDPKARLVVSYQFVSSNAIICSSVIISLTLTLAQCPAWFFFVWQWLPWLSALLSHALHLLRYSLPADLPSAATSPISWKCMCKGSIKWGCVLWVWNLNTMPCVASHLEAPWQMFFAGKVVSSWVKMGTMESHHGEENFFFFFLKLTGN